MQIFTWLLDFYHQRISLNVKKQTCLYNLRSKEAENNNIALPKCVAIISRKWSSSMKDVYYMKHSSLTFLIKENYAFFKNQSQSYFHHKKISIFPTQKLRIVFWYNSFLPKIRHKIRDGKVGFSSSSFFVQIEKYPNFEFCGVQDFFLPTNFQNDAPSVHSEKWLHNIWDNRVQ